MGEMAEIWNEVRERQRKEKDKSLAHAYKSLPGWLSLLNRAGVTHKKLSDTHYRLTAGKRRVDWWPTTGTAREVNGPWRGYGMKDLIDFFRPTPTSEDLKEVKP